MKKDIYEDFGGKIRKCTCGKIFIPGGEWVYKSKNKKGGTKYYCSYTCWRKAGEGSGKDTKYVSRGVK